ncbi:unnamed protein product [Linum tenue]|uniref:FH2 domain-containing protein n=1 Tax=Linum tenue TaxID=586396 RepID=A0AAV0M674_9ROSI|nr:unnamed protein product [Linum tenue]
MIQVRVDPLRQHPAHPEIGNLDVLAGIDQQIGGLDVAVDDLAAVESPPEEEEGAEHDEIEDESTSRNAIPLLRGKSLTSQFSIPSETRNPYVTKQPPPPPPLQNKALAPPPPAPPRKPNAPPPPPPGKAGPTSRQTANESNEKSGESSGSGAQVKLKSLHWDKLNKNNADHPMAWDKLHGASFRVDGDLMEALFGYVATNRKSPNSEGGGSSSHSNNLNHNQNLAASPRSQIELFESLMDGHGLDADLLEKLTRIAPTKEVETQILEFTGGLTRLADAESFLYHLLKVIPSALPV